MAELLLKQANPTAQFGCYSERGLMSYFTFVVLPTQLGDFLASLQFPAGVTSPFAELRGQSPEAVLFSELDFGKEGFGCPDGAIFVKLPEPHMIFVEVKLNESYAGSCRAKSYNSTIKGQLELRWRLATLSRRPRQFYDRTAYIQETPEFRAVYDKDEFYRAEGRQDEHWPGSWRRVKCVEGVQQMLGYLQLCQERVYFCAITREPNNPFDELNEAQMPVCAGQTWPEARGHFCWVPVDQIRNATPRPHLRDGNG